MKKIALAVIAGIAVWLIAAFVGSLLVDSKANGVGVFLESYAVLIGILAGLWAFFADRV